MARRRKRSPTKQERVAQDIAREARHEAIRADIHERIERGRQDQRRIRRALDALVVTDDRVFAEALRGWIQEGRQAMVEMEKRLAPLFHIPPELMMKVLK